MIQRRLEENSWEIDNLIGKKVRILRSQAWKGGVRKCRAFYTVSEVFFRISLDGKVICSVLLEELPDDIFTLKDIALYETNVKEDDKSKTM